MTFNEWIALTPEARDTIRKEWHVFEPGYWHTLANEAASRFMKEFGADPHILRVCKSLYRSEELIIAVQTDCSNDGLLSLPECYLGFRVLQFASKTPEGVLVDVAPVADAAG
jgi:hypothetical protein